MKTTPLPQNRFKGKQDTHFITNRVFSWKRASPHTQNGSVRCAGFVSLPHAKKSSRLNRLKQSHVSLLTYLGAQNEKIIIIIIIIIMTIIKKHGSCEREAVYLCIRLSIFFKFTCNFHVLFHGMLFSSSIFAATPGTIISDFFFFFDPMLVY